MYINYVLIEHLVIVFSALNMHVYILACFYSFVRLYINTKCDTTLHFWKDQKESKPDEILRKSFFTSHCNLSICILYDISLGFPQWCLPLIFPSLLLRILPIHISFIMEIIQTTSWLLNLS